MKHTKTITIEKQGHAGTVHALFHLDESGKLERIDGRYRKAGTQESKEIHDTCALATRLLSYGETLDKIAMTIHPGPLREAIEEFMKIRGGK